MQQSEHFGQNSNFSVLTSCQAAKLKNYLGIVSYKEDEDESFEWAKEKERIRLKFWRQPNRDAMIWILIANTSNLLFQIRALVNPLTPAHFQTNAVYTVGTLIQYACILGSLKTQKHSSLLLKIAMFLLTIRNGFRVFDVEQTKGNGITLEDFNFLATQQHIAVFACIFMFFNSLELGKFKILSALFFMMLMFI